MTAMHGDEYLIAFDPDKCTQCHGCEVACRIWRETDRGVRYRRVLNIWQGEYPQVKSASLSLACLHCVEPACAAACPEEAITKHSESGLVEVDHGLCIGCRVCAEVCPFGILQFAGDGIMQKCDLCHGQPLAGAVPPCVDTCPGQALSLIKVDASGKLAHEKEISQLLGAG